MLSLIFQPNMKEIWQSRRSSQTDRQIDIARCCPGIRWIFPSNIKTIRQTVSEELGNKHIHTHLIARTSVSTLYNFLEKLVTSLIFIRFLKILYVCNCGTGSLNVVLLMTVRYTVNPTTLYDKRQGVTEKIVSGRWYGKLEIQTENHFSETIHW